MNQPNYDLKPITLLIIGTDAAGKDHIANIAEKLIAENGGTSEKRKRYLCGNKTDETTSSNKSRLELFLEKSFLLLFPLLGFMITPTLNHLLKKDFSHFKQPDKPLIIVGHNCLRGLAFYWGHKHKTPSEINPPAYLLKTLNTMKQATNIITICLDVEDSIRQKRIQLRKSRGEADNFDLYMAENSERSERIEQFLVWLAIEKLGGRLIENNDLSEIEIREILTHILQQNKSFSPQS